MIRDILKELDRSIGISEDLESEDLDEKIWMRRFG